MHQTYSPENQRAHQRLDEQTELFINNGGHIERIPSGVTTSPLRKTKAQVSSERVVKP